MVFQEHHHVPPPREKLPPIDTQTRITLQLHLMYRMKGDTLTNEFVNEWISTYAERVASIIDGGETPSSKDVSVRIRDLLAVGDIETAADIVFNQLQSLSLEAHDEESAQREVPPSAQSRAITSEERQVA